MSHGERRRHCWLFGEEHSSLLRRCQLKNCEPVRGAAGTSYAGHNDKYKYVAEFQPQEKAEDVVMRTFHLGSVMHSNPNHTPAPRAQLVVELSCTAPGSSTISTQIPPPSSISYVLSVSGYTLIRHSFLPESGGRDDFTATGFPQISAPCQICWHPCA